MIIKEMEEKNKSDKIKEVIMDNINKKVEISENDIKNIFTEINEIVSNGREIMKVIKRDEREEKFNSNKIKKAIIGATNGNIEISEDEIQSILTEVKEILYEKFGTDVKVEDIHDTIIELLFQKGISFREKGETEKGNKYTALATNYSVYRKERDFQRQKKTALMKAVKTIGLADHATDNANVSGNFSAKLLGIASETNKISNLSYMPKDIARMHETGELYYHDLDSFNLTTNCLHTPKGILERGFNTGYGNITTPKRIESGAELICILIQSIQNDQFGGVSIYDLEKTLGFLVPKTRKEIYDLISSINPNEDEDVLKSKTEVILRKRVAQAMQGIVYNLNTMHSRAGSQVPFSSVNMGLPSNKDEALISELFLKMYDKGLGGCQPIFPNILFAIKNGVNGKPEDPYYYLYQLACKVSSTKMNPTFMNIDADYYLKYYNQGYRPATMGCRTDIMSNINGEPGVEGRGNIAPHTMNIVRLAIMANHDVDKFFTSLHELEKKCRDSLLYRYSVLKQLKVKDLRFIAGQKIWRGSENLSLTDSIEPILRQGTWGIGFVGLAECLVALIGKHHGESEEARELGLRIIKDIRTFCDKSTKIFKLNFSCYASPAETVCSKLLDKDKIRFGIIKGVTDKTYYTNSFHVPVGYPISVIDKIKIEAPYHELCNGGHISYIEFDSYPSPEEIQKYLDWARANTNIGYIAFNFHIRYCKKCGAYLNGEDSCPKCGSKEIQGISRVTGYLSLDERFCKGKRAERKDRVDHNASHAHAYDKIG